MGAVESLRQAPAEGLAVETSRATPELNRLGETAGLPAARALWREAQSRSPAGFPWRAAALWVGAATGLLAVFLIDPATAGFLPPCPFRLFTGLLCPGCGGTRALHQLLHGRPAAALALNPLLPLYLAAAGWVLLAQLREALGLPPHAGAHLSSVSIRGRSGLVPRAWPWALLALALAFAVARNLPGWPASLGGAAAL